MSSTNIFKRLYDFIYNIRVRRIFFYCADNLWTDFFFLPTINSMMYETNLFGDYILFPGLVTYLEFCI